MAFRCERDTTSTRPSLAGSYTPPPNKPTSVHLSPTASSRNPKTIGMPKAPIEYAHEIRQCTFSPRVKGVAAHMKQARAWTSVEVTERLAAQPPPPPPPPKPKQQTIGGPSIDFQEFVRRQGRDSSRRARKAEARQKETPRECSFKPRLCENSKRMARNSKFDDRQNRLEARRLQRMASGDREKFSGHLESDAKNPPDAPRPRETFRPEVTAKAKARPARTADAQSRIDAARRQAATKRVEASLAARRAREETFRPRLNHQTSRSWEDVKPRLLAPSRRARDATRAPKRDDDLEACSFRPHLVAQCPAYIHAMADASRASKRAEPAPPPPPKPMFFHGRD
uniref:Uncharacterized protein n=1 Tax=Pelagomonas calceolata TaxID=35677 RepID=A0A7S3ZTT4_9STRA